MKMGSAFAALAIAAGLALAASQDESRPIFRVTATEVLLEFIAIDRQGRFVTDLSAGELTLKVDGKEVKIESLVPPLPESRALVVTPGQLPPGGREAASADPPAAVPGSAPLPRLPARTVILLDSRTIDSSNFHHSIRAIRRFVEESLEARHLVALAEVRRGLVFLSPFTDDRQVLLEAAEKLRPESVYNPLDPRRMKEGMGEPYFQELQQQVGYLRDSLQLLCHSLSGFPGRKHVVFFSEGYPLKPLDDLQLLSQTGAAFAFADERQQTSRDVASHTEIDVTGMIEDVVALANGFGISFYTIDARGLVAAQGFGDTSARDQESMLPKGPGVPITATGRGQPQAAVGNVDLMSTAVAFQLTNLNTLDDAQNTLVALAAGTNGSSFFNSNDLEAVVRASTREQRYAYLLSFTPEAAGRRKFHNVRVSTSRPQVVIRSQVGFRDTSEQELTGLRLAAAFQRPELFRYLQPLVEFEPGSGNLRLVMGVGGEQVSGRRSGQQIELELAFVGRVFGERGKPVSAQPEIARLYRASLSLERFRGLVDEPLLANEELALSPGRYRLVLVVLDQVSGTVGTVSREFVVPMEAGTAPEG